jgi:hypothetical protein
MVPIDKFVSPYKDSSDSYISPVLSMLKRSLSLLITAREQAKEQHFGQIKQLEIIVDQVRQIVNKKPKYAASTVVMAFILYSQSPTCYELIRLFNSPVIFQILTNKIADIYFRR